MMNYKVLWLIASVITPYLMRAFIVFDLNSANWSENDRGMTVLAMVISIVSTSLFMTIKNK